MKEVEDFRARDTWEQVLVPPRKTDDFMREHGPADENPVVTKHPGVDFDRDIHRKKTAAQFRNLRLGDHADLLEGSRIVPFVVNEPNGGVLAAALVQGDVEPLADSLLGHRLVCA